MPDYYKVSDLSQQSQRLLSRLGEEVLVLDGAMGTMIQRLNLSESDFRADRFVDSSVSLKGCNDLLCLTRPDDITAIHTAYLEAGADIIETNTFNANSISLAEYGLQNHVAEICRAGARIASNAVDSYCALHGIPEARRPFVAGSMGPTGVSLSIATNQENAPAADFDTLAEAYCIQASALIEGGVDILLLETVFDTLNVKAAIYGVKQAMHQAGREYPLMISATLTQQGRLLSGQSLKAFVASVEHSGAISLGLNCGFGAETMMPYVDALSSLTPRFVSAHPNAGLPDAMGRYTDTPQKMAREIAPALRASHLNIIGGCCGSTPEHIAAIAAIARQSSPRRRPQLSPELVLSGTEAYEFSSPAKVFTRVGERCNVAGSRKFLRLINESQWSEAVEIAAGQIAKGAAVLDINMDAPLLDAAKAMVHFVGLLCADMETSRVPLMIDSSDFKVVRSALRLMQGKGVVNSISLKNGEDDFLTKAREIHALGAAVVVMAFDEQGQADTYPRRIEICSRAYRLLTEKVGFRGCDIIFDPNILAVATGLDAHRRYALDFLEATAWIKQNLPGAKVSGGVSNLSFSFRGNDAVRKAMHSIFLQRAFALGMDMAIVNPADPVTSQHVEPKLHQLIDDVLLDRDADATHRLVEEATRLKEEAIRLKEAKTASTNPQVAAASSAPLSNSEKLCNLLVKGDDTDLTHLLEEALKETGDAMTVVSDILMKGMNRVGDLFGAGRLFLPQVVRSASVMKKAVEILTPHITADARNQSAKSRPVMILATVKGDVHDIGKNIVGVVMRCSGFDVIDLGVMVSAEEIVDSAREHNADFIGLSGLITPSLHEMAEVATIMEQRGLHIPLFVGGATTSDLHTAVKIAPNYSGPVMHTGDAAILPAAASRLIEKESASQAAAKLKSLQQSLRENYEEQRSRLSLKEAFRLRPDSPSPAPTPHSPGIHILRIPVEEAMKYFNTRALLAEWGLNPNEPDMPEARRVIADAKSLLSQVTLPLTAKVELAPAVADGDDIVMCCADAQLRIPCLRQSSPNPKTGHTLALSDFLAPKDDWLGLFVVTVAGSGIPERIQELSKEDEYKSLLLQSASHRLVEAATEWMHRHVRSSLWRLPEGCGIRPAVGYDSMPDQSMVFVLDEAIHYASLGIRPTEHGALYPSATTTGLIFGNPASRYFSVGRLSAEQRADYARRRRLPEDFLKAFLKF